MQERVATVRLVVVGKSPTKKTQTGNKKHKTLEPITNLEDHFRPDWWRYKAVPCLRK